MPIIEQIAEETWPDWRNHLPSRVGGLSWEYDPLLQVARQVMVMLKRKDELEQNLGTATPAVQVPQPVLHPLIELQASPQLQIGKLDHAVFASMKAVGIRVDAGARRPACSAVERFAPRERGRDLKPGIAPFALIRLPSRLSPGSRGGPGSGTRGAASTSSWTRSAGSAPA
jgi:hypothetical protein